jgi:DNA-binding protein YbaB
VNLHGELQELVIDPSVVDPADVPMLQDLILAAITEAQRSAKAQADERMKALTGGLPIPPGLM